MGRAYAAAGEPEQREKYLTLAREALADIAEDEDRRMIEAQIASVPE